ncbi:trehalase-like isoform X2 [Metopolophium dirhodum]|uniref:trehalase-like isoform X2 n=1 Tax=Metopolophium dirhodum TaxID=44670 RepID=UPI00298FED24|nr:trehalase-like isoform X2 [Metopolophium dirhodum]
MKCFYLLLMLLLLQVVYYKQIIARDAIINMKQSFFQPLDELLPSCHSKIYCNSEFLHDVQIYCNHPNCTNLISKKLKYTESEILAKYDQMKRNNNNVPSDEDLVKFIDENFEESNELIKWTPKDFTDKPSILNRIKDKTYIYWARALNNLWMTLARKIKDDVKIHPDKYSLVWVPNGFIIPGGIFKELYYWDTYWIVNGLLQCDMRTTARGIIENIISMVDQFGFMPNGNRVFYLNRSQPPMLILMALSYYKATNDFDFIKTIIGSLENEYLFWLKNRMVTFEKDGKQYTMARYSSRSSGPRPESYRNDYKLAEKHQRSEDKNELYIHIKSAAESGWDFSSRWFITVNGTNSGNLSDIQTANIVPVDLNSMLHVNALTLSTWFDQMGDEINSAKYRTIANEFLENIQEVMWRPNKGAWFDWDLINNKSREYFYASNIVPLWTESYNMPKEKVANAVLKYLSDQRIIELDYSINYNGIPTSMYSSSQQWDFPNAWPPLQAFIIQGLDKTQQKNAKQVAVKLAEVWLRTNYRGFTNNESMFEKV